MSNIGQFLILTLFRMGYFGATHGWVGGGGGKHSLFPEICYIYLKVMKLDTVIPYRKKM